MSDRFVNLACRLPETPALLGADRAVPGRLLLMSKHILIRDQARRLWVWPIIPEHRRS
jgi:hypothetical protein